METLKTKEILKKYDFSEIYMKREIVKTDIKKYQEKRKGLAAGSKRSKLNKKIIRLKKLVNSYNVSLVEAYFKKFIKDNLKVGNRWTYDIGHKFKVIEIREDSVRLEEVSNYKPLEIIYSFKNIYYMYYKDYIFKGEGSPSYSISSYINEEIEFLGKLEMRNNLIGDLLSEDE